MPSAADAGRAGAGLVRFADRLVGVVNVVAALATITIFVVMILQIVSRYVFNSALFWADEAAVWAMAWLVMLASVGLAWDWRHVHVPLVLLALPLRIRIPFIILSKVLSAAFLVLLVWYGFQVFEAGFHRTSPGLGISTRWFKLAIPVSASLMLLILAAAILRDLAAWRAGETARFARYGREDLPE